jgi:hypothetical protein
MKQYLAGINKPHILRRRDLGDMARMPSVLEDVAVHFPVGLQYTGLDIVPEAVTSNKEKLGGGGGGGSGNKVSYEFSVFDITSNPPPKADMLICRDLV